MTQPSPYFIRPTPPPHDPAHPLGRPLAFEEEEGRIDFLAYWHTVRKHIRLIVVIVLAVALMTALRVLMMTPIYTATATLLLKPGTPAILSQNGVPVDAQGGDAFDYYDNFSATQLEILKSRTLAAMVIKNEGFDRDPSFIGAGAVRPSQPGFFDRVRKRLAEEIHQSFPGAGQVRRNPPVPKSEPSAMGVNAGAIALYLGELNVQPVPGTSLVRIMFTTPDPQLSARLANAHARGYIREGIELHTQANEEAEKFLKQKLVELKEQLEKSEVALNAYRREKGIVPGEMTLDGKETMVLDRVSELSQDLTKAQVDRIALEAQVQQINKHNLGAVPAVMSNATITGLQGQLAAVDAEYASMAKQFKPEYPPLAQLEAKRQELMSQINLETRKVLDATQAAYGAAAAKETKLQSEMEKQRGQALSLNDAAVEYAILQREVDTNRELYNSILQRMKDIGLAAEARSSNILIVDEAEPPGAPSAPRKMQDVFRNVMLALAGGVGLSFLLEYLNNTLKTPEDVERYLKVASLAVIPAFARTGERPYAPVKFREPDLPMKLGYGKELVGAHGPNSLIGESYRTLRTALMLSRAGAPPKTILFTSATNSEGKTVTASNTAVMFAHSGVKVILVDADLRRPRCHKIFAVDNQQGLTEALTGTREINKLIRPTGIEGLSLLSSGSFPPNPTELLGSEKMRQTLEELMRTYDVVVIDSPPIMPVSDGLLLSTLVDGVVLVVNSAQTARQQSRAALARLEFARAKIFGVVLNKVNIQSPDYRFYQHYYYSHYSRYDPESAAREEGAEPEEMI